GEDWHDDVVEDDYRPYRGTLGRCNDGNLYVIKATAVLADDTRLVAHLDYCPMEFGAPDGASVVVFAPDGQRLDLIPADMGLDDDLRRRRLAALSRGEEAIFPLRVASDEPGLPVVTVLDWFTQR